MKCKQPATATVFRPVIIIFTSLVLYVFSIPVAKYEHALSSFSKLNPFQSQNHVNYDINLVLG